MPRHQREQLFGILGVDPMAAFHDVQMQAPVLLLELAETRYGIARYHARLRRLYHLNLNVRRRCLQYIPHIQLDELAEGVLERIEVETPDVRAVAILQIRCDPLRCRPGDAG